MSNKPGTSAQSAPRPGGYSNARNEASTKKNTTPGDGNDKQLLENSYARQLYFQHTNLTELIAKKLPKRSETTRRNYATQLYELFLLQPDMRIHDPFHEVRFDTRYNEGLFYMARNIPLITEQTLTQHKQTLAAAGIRQLCFVDMTKNNLMLEYQEKGK
uniref:Uncharacterized protein n=1 Tax=Anopheles dirus TaxID=7168 RepID=A0A182N2X9_9DIPT